MLRTEYIDIVWRASCIGKITHAKRNLSTPNSPQDVSNATDANSYVVIYFVSALLKLWNEQYGVSHRIEVRFCAFAVERQSEVIADTFSPDQVSHPAAQPSWLPLSHGSPLIPPKVSVGHPQHHCHFHVPFQDPLRFQRPKG